MRYFNHKILVMLALVSVYFFETRSDSSLLSQICTNSNSLANYSEISKKTHPADEFSEISWDEWYEKCNNLPFGRKLEFKNYKNKAIEWDELERAINEFIKVNSIILSQHNDWIEDAPTLEDTFFTTKNVPLDPIKPFVQKIIVEPGTQIAFHGDFHGDVHSMVDYIQRLNTDKYMNGFKITDPNFYLVFLGDYEDRGLYGAEVWYSLMRLKIANPNHVIIIRGNHEGLIFRGGFIKECNDKFSGKNAFDKFSRIFDFLPPALYLGSGSSTELNYLLCVHGGVEKKFNSKKLLSSPSKLAFDWLKFGDNFPEAYTTIGFMWNDFEYNPTSKNVIKDGRGTSFGKTKTAKFLQGSSNKNSGYELKGIFRAHQHGKHDLMTAMLNGGGVAKIWADEANEDKDLWDNIVCTFLVGPDTPYGQALNYTFDGFGILTTADKYEDWKLEILQNEVISK